MGSGTGRRPSAVDSLVFVEFDSAAAAQSRDSTLRRNGAELQPRESTMNEPLKVQPHHIERDAYLYIRQSSMRQVLENIESTKRQYGLRSRATALGWPDERVVVIDSDQGESGASAAWREGFRRLVSDVGMGRAGIVMGLEVSRLARNNADWHRLLEICALSDTLIPDLLTWCPAEMSGQEGAAWRSGFLREAWELLGAGPGNASPRIRGGWTA
jgi:hypothetical protein